ncbi:MAG TPA: type II toxin-antitoxin system Phd/YefM family antitoxin [Leucothrix mucor]|uniref:Antitoxin n=1 Tax=Leucothrix mucor TaxID=45248 RepID=A0A7V2SZP3_LEUMU|nr:type II toxin-antitoxin system Phd/YefM family antitoxin [Leucothrix mucor]
MPVYSIAEAKTHLPQLIHKAEQEGEIHLSRHGKEVAVIISIQKYQLLNRKQLNFGEVLDNLFEQDIFIEETDFFDQDRTATTDRGFSF